MWRLDRSWRRRGTRAFGQRLSSRIIQPLCTAYDRSYSARPIGRARGRRRVATTTCPLVADESRISRPTRCSSWWRGARPYNPIRIRSRGTGTGGHIRELSLRWLRATLGARVIDAVSRPDAAGRAIFARDSHRCRRQRARRDLRAHRRLFALSRAGEWRQQHHWSSTLVARAGVLALALAPTRPLEL